MLPPNLQEAHEKGKREKEKESGKNVGLGGKLGLEGHPTLPRKSKKITKSIGSEERIEAVV